MLETILTTNEALRLALAMSGLAAILALGMLAVVVYLMNEWRKDLDGLKAYLEQTGVTKSEEYGTWRVEYEYAQPTKTDLKEAMSR
ncbi:MAG: hypothetical protein IJ113_03395 [Eggerthellaceae bacterium]|nr:hypothetical protein [Eggerthellaceae bacterium]